MKMYSCKIMVFLGVVGNLLFFGCEEREVMEYKGEDGIYFDVQYGANHGDESVWAHQNYTYVSFGSMEAEETEVTLKIGIVGSIKDYDRPFRVMIVQDSTNAIPDEEYTGFSEEQVIKAGENKTYVTLKVFKTPRQAKDTLQILFRIDPGEYFTLPFIDFGAIPGRWTDVRTEFKVDENPAEHRVIFNNILQRPAGWGINEYSQFFGTFSPKKYQYLMDITGYTKAHFEQLSAITQGGRGAKIQSAARTDLQRMFNLGYNRLRNGDADGWQEWMLEDRGTMMWVPGITWWSEETLPEELVKQYYRPSSN